MDPVNIPGWAMCVIGGLAVASTIAVTLKGALMAFKEVFSAASVCVIAIRQFWRSFTKKLNGNGDHCGKSS